MYSGVEMCQPPIRNVVVSVLDMSLLALGDCFQRKVYSLTKSDLFIFVSYNCHNSTASRLLARFYFCFVRPWIVLFSIY